MSLSLSLYHRMPRSTRSIVASARGYYLRWWRYDKQTERLVEEALERDYWTKTQWDDWRQERLSYILHRAATKVPYYRDMWSKRRQNGDRSSYEYIENWPILEKQTLRERNWDFIADDRNPRFMFRDHTSGTTGTSLDIWLTRETVKYWYALTEARWKRWYGVSRQDRWAILGGQLVTPVSQQEPPFWVWNSGLNQLYLSSYHLCSDAVRWYLDAISKYRVTYLLGYPSAIYTLALEAQRLDRKDFTLDVVIANAEPLYDHQRHAIARAFACPVRETYGMAEVVAAAGECEEGSLHYWPEVGLIQTGTTANDLNSDFICTGLINADMPLIRYRVGDSGSLRPVECACGRHLPLIRNVEGRSDDLLYTIEGRQIGRLDPVFKSKLPIVEAQIIQKSLTMVKVRYVPANDFSNDTLATLRRRIQERMGQLEVTFERVPAIPRTARGKFRAVVSELSAEDRARLI